MSLTDALYLLRQHWKLLVGLPLLLAASCLFFLGRQQKTYASDTTIYTGIMSGYSLKGNAATDYYGSGNAFDNLLNLITSRATKEEAAFRLLADQLHRPAGPGLVPLAPALQQQLRGATPEETAKRIANYAHQNTRNEVYQLLNSGAPTYSLAALGHLTATRLATSDLIKLEYEANDPAMCQRTLQIITQVFLDKSRQLREGQTASVIDYYAEATRRAKSRLDSAERKFLAFNRDNNIINYEAQSKNVAAEKEALNSQAGAVEMQYAAAQSGLQAVSRKLAGRSQAVLTSNNILAQRRRLVQLNEALADQQLFAQQNAGSNQARVANLRAEAARTEQAIRTSVNAYYDRTTNTNGLASKDLLGEWMRNMVLAEQGRAQLTVLNRRKAEFEREYQRMAPLGATLKRIEREIDLAEKAYLSLLGSLNESRSTQQNTELVTNLKIVDPPNLPLEPQRSKRLLLVMLSLMGGFALVAGAVFGASLLDRNLRRPAVATALTGLPVAGIVPVAQPGRPAAAPRSLEQLVRLLLLRSGGTARPADAPFVVGVLSTRQGQGKTALCQALAQSTNAIGLDVLTLYPEGTSASPADPRTGYYPAATAAVQGCHLAELTTDQQRLSQVVVIEFPALLEAIYPVAVLPDLHLVLLVARADHGWHEADQKAVADLRAATSAPVELVLTNVRAQDAAAFLGTSGVG